MNIGNNLIKLREEKGLKQYELAKMINVSDKTISSYENNRSLPNIEILVLIANALDTNIDTILGLNKENVISINKAYEQKKYKDTLIKFAFFIILFIVPILFFYYATYTGIGYFIASILENEYVDIVTQADLTMKFYNNFIITYIIYVLFLFINYILYKKKLSILMLIINGIILLFFTIDIIIEGLPLGLELLIFPVVALFGVIFSLKLLKNKHNKLKK